MNKSTTGLRRRLVLIRPEGPASGAEMIGRTALDECFELTVRPVAQPTPTASVVGIAERFYRWLDERLYRTLPAAPAPAQHTDADCPPSATVLALTDAIPVKGGHVIDRLDATLLLWITFDGKPFSALHEAVRARLAQPGGMVQCQVIQLNPDGDATVVFSAWCCLDHRSLSRSVVWIAAKLPALVTGALARLAGGVGPALVSEDPHVQFPRPRSAANLTLALALRAAQRLIARDQWFIQLHATQANQRWPGQWLSAIEPPRDAFWADPFLMSHEGRHWLLFEEQLFDSPHAHIAALELDAAGRAVTPAHPVLREPWHLSYPFIWQEPGRLCMIPESSANRSVDLYEADNPAGPWRKTATLLAGRRLADATVVAFRGRLWMFAAGATERGCIYDELHLFWADRIEGPWHAHALNPVKIDARSARPAGAMWVEDGVLYRVAQDCSTVYGGAVTRLRIDELTPERFAETVLRPDDSESPFVPGYPWHTLNADNDVLVIDLLRRRLRWPLQRRS